MSKVLDNLESEIAILKQLHHPHITELTDIVVRISFHPPMFYL